MSKNNLPLKEISIEELFMSGEASIYEIPIYQRNYAWEKEEITTLIQDVYDAFSKSKKNTYYIGTLVSYHKGDRVFEIIDGQQRLTTISIILKALGLDTKNRLTYRARKRSDDTLRSIPDFDVDDKDKGIENGFKYAKNAINELVPHIEKNEFEKYFRNRVHIIHYKVPKDIDLNHYFEIMNSRGEQLEKHEIVKANLMQDLNDSESMLFNLIWESCSDMSVYVQQKINQIQPALIFGKSLCEFVPDSFDHMLAILNNCDETGTKVQNWKSISEILNPNNHYIWKQIGTDNEKNDAFQPIIDFPNFLLIVLKLTNMSKADFDPLGFQLDDKELITEFKEAAMTVSEIKRFAYNLLKARFFLYNYMVHHAKEEDTIDSNPWKLQVWHKEERAKKGTVRNLCGDIHQDLLVQLLSMFEVTFTARQRKNYLFYCLMFLMEQKNIDNVEYAEFVEELADRYFNKVYLDKSKLNDVNTPLPGSFDECMLYNGKLNREKYGISSPETFSEIYGNGSIKSKGVPLYVFNYLDFRIWKKYAYGLRSGKMKENSPERQRFFTELGCSDFGLRIFDQFYFSRTRRSLEHYYPQASATGKDGALDSNQINCLGNYAMIGSEANSSGSNWSPKTKLDHYLDKSGKISQISVASLKFLIMMQLCKDNENWEYEEISKHQKKMLELLF